MNILVFGSVDLRLPGGGREEAQRKPDIYIYIYIYMYMNICIYIYICIERERDR